MFAAISLMIARYSPEIIGAHQIALNIASLPNVESNNSHVNILFLPYGEIHDLGLMFLNYTLKLKGEKVIYLGKSIPFDNLFYLNSFIF